MTTDSQTPQKPVQIRLSQILRAAYALLVGLLLFTLLSAALGRLAGLEVSPREGMEKVGAALLSLIVTALLTGYATARIAGIWQLWLSAALGAFLAISTGASHLTWQGLPYAAALPVSLLALVPAAVAGAWAAGWMARRQSRKLAEEPLSWPIEIRQRSGFLWFAILLCVGMTGAGLWALRFEDTPPRVWEGILVFGAGALFLTWRALFGKPHAILRDEGIELAAFRSLIPWSEIESAAPSPLNPLEAVRLRVRDPQRYLDRLTPLQRALTQTGEREPNFTIGLTGTRFTPETLCDLIRPRLGTG